MKYYGSGCLLATFLLLVVLAGCAGISAEPTPPPFQPPTAGTPIDPPRPVADFALINQSGNPFRLGDLQGTVVLLYFGYTFCPDICPTTLAEFVRVKRALGSESDKVAVVFISVDGERDTPEKLKTYLAGFDPSFIGLTGEEGMIRKVGVDYGLFFEKQKVEGTSADYLIDHSAASFLIDQQGRLVMIYGYGTPAEVIAADIRTLIAPSP